MSIEKINEKTLDRILEKMLNTVENTKQDIFEIGEQSRQELESLTKELQFTRMQVNETIAICEQLEMKTRHARMRLTDVSKNFSLYTEEQVKEAYDIAFNLQTELTIQRQKEQQLRMRRDELERRLKNLEKTVEKAESLVSQITVVISYLTGDLHQVNQIVKDAQKKQEFGLRIIEAQEEERKRISRDIHDGPAQMLANVMMRSDLIERVSKEKGMEEAIKEVRSLKEMVRSALYEVRKIIYDLRPMALDDLGLLPALRRYLNTMQDYYRVTIALTVYGKEVRLPSKFEVALFRLIQESVQNACKHAEAYEIKVKVQFEQEMIIVVVKDDGKGFDITKTEGKKFGIIGMKERIDLLKGDITITSEEQQGTTVVMKVPLVDEAY